MIKEEWVRFGVDGKNVTISILTKNLPSKLFNATARCVSGIKLHDFNCGLKAYRKDVVKISSCTTRCTGTFRYWSKAQVLPKSAKKPVQHQPRNMAKANSEQVVFLTVISI